MSEDLETETSIAMNRKKIASSWIIYTVLLIAYSAIVFYLGYRTALVPMNKIAKGMKSYTFGDFLRESDLKELTSVYLNPKEMEDRIQDVLFEPAKLVAPFVGDVPSCFSKPGPRPKTNLYFRIFLTGGSTAFGSGAPSQEKTVGGYLEEMLNTDPPQKGIRYEVITYANTAWSTTHERIMIINCLSEWEPDLIISLSGCNDVYYGSLGKNIQWFRTPAEENFYHLITLTFEQITGNVMPDVTSDDNVAIQPDIVARRLMRNVHVISDSLLRDNIPYVFALQPTLAVTHKELVPREEKHLSFQKNTSGYFNQCYSLFRSELKTIDNSNFSFLDLTSVFDDMPLDAVFIDMYHFGDKGNKVIAENLAYHIRQHYAAAIH